MKADPDTLLLLSGGLDSTYVLWERVQKGQLTHAHHIHLRDRGNRRDAEARAVDGVLRWLNQYCGGRNLIHYTESHVDHGTIGWNPLAVYQIAYWAAVIATQGSLFGSGYSSVIVPLCADDHPAAVREFERVFQGTMQLQTGRDLPLEWPIIDMTKRDLIAGLPADLLALVSWCSKPSDGRPCGWCDSCKTMAAALKDPAPCARLPAATGLVCNRPGGHDGACSPRPRGDGEATP